VCVAMDRRNYGGKKNFNLPKILLEYCVFVGVMEDAVSSLDWLTTDVIQQFSRGRQMYTHGCDLVSGGDVAGLKYECDDGRSCFKAFVHSGKSSSKWYIVCGCVLGR